jgi:hypothetical protein
MFICLFLTFVFLFDQKPTPLFGSAEFKGIKNLQLPEGRMVRLSPLTLHHRVFPMQHQARYRVAILFLVQHTKTGKIYQITIRYLYQIATKYTN